MHNLGLQLNKLVLSKGDKKLYNNNTGRIIRAQEPVIKSNRGINIWDQVNLPGVGIINNTLGSRVMMNANKVAYPALALKSAPGVRVQRIELVGKGKDKYMGSPERRIGIADIMRNTSRVKGRFNAQLYWDSMHYKTIICLFIGYSIWWLNTPDIILQAPGVLTRPELGGLIKIVKDTFINHVCHEHQVPSPCECGERVNTVAQAVFGEDLTEGQIRRARARSLATMVGGLLIALLLAKNSIPSEGIDSGLLR